MLNSFFYVSKLGVTSLSVSNFNNDSVLGIWNLL